MWAIRVLTGPQAGHIFPIKPGATVIGRAPACEIKLLSPSISKEHVKIEVLGDKFILTDMGSRNGTFVNGIQAKTTRVRPGDKIGLHDIIIEIIPFTGNAYAPPPMVQGNVAYNLSHQAAAPEPHAAPPAPVDRSAPAFAKFAKEYLDRVVLPGVHRLAEVMEFKWVLAVFMAAFILLVTSLSTIPLIRILRESMEEQSRQHALTIAASIARLNEGAIREGLYTAINMGTARRVGVKSALIIQALDGKIIAPASLAEKYPDMPYVHEARKYNQESVAQVDPGTVIALYPVDAYNPETGTRGILAYSVVEYDMSSLAVDNSKTLSLFISTLFIALIVGGILFFFLYKMIEYPIVSLNSQLDSALKEGRDNLHSEFQFQPIKKLIANINSALTRAQSGGGSDLVAPPALEHDRRMEMNNLVELVGFAAMSISAFDRTISSINPAFEAATGFSTATLVHQSVEMITDQAMKLSVLDLIERVEANPESMATNELEFGGNNYQFIAQAVFGTSRPAYYVMVLVPVDGGSE